MFEELESLEEIQKHSESAVVELAIEQDSAIEYNYEKSINNIRNRFGLKILDDKSEEILESLFDESQLNMPPYAKSDKNWPLEIKIESEMNLSIVDATDALSEKDFQLDQHEEMSEVSSDIQQLSPSRIQFKDRDDLDFNIDEDDDEDENEDDNDNDEEEEEEDEEMEDDDENSDLELEHEEQKQKRKRYRKSDEEKLFE